MKALVVYESMWGNTEQVARSIAEGLSEDAEVEVVEVTGAPADPGEQVALIVAGGPTHAFSMTRRNTREEATEKGATHGSVDVGLREWLEELPAGHHVPAVATFDTRIAKARHMPGSAAKSAARAARRHGYETHERQSFYVTDIDGPLVEGEVDRARQWGRQLAAATARQGAQR